MTACPDGAKAWRIFEKHPGRLHLVMTGQVMPDLTGMGLARKTFTVRRDVPVILFTGYSETVTSQQAKAAGIRAFLMKPITSKETAETVRRVLDESRTAGSDAGVGGSPGGGSGAAGDPSGPGDDWAQEVSPPVP